MSIPTTWLSAFHYVAQLGSFTRAAEQLNVGQSTISSHVKSLESYSQVELFYRQGRTVELTTLGEELLTITRGLFGHRDEAIALLRAARMLDHGKLYLQAVGPFDVMEILEEFRRRYPGIDTPVAVAFERDILSALEDFSCDIGVVGRFIDDPRFTCTRYNHHEIVVVVNANHRFANRSTIPLAGLADEPLILRSRISTTRRQFDAAVERQNIKLGPIMEIDSREAVREAVDRGLGAGIVSRSEYPSTTTGRIVHIEDEDIRTSAYLICLAERRDRPLIQSFFDTAESIPPEDRGAALRRKDRQD